MKYTKQYIAVIPRKGLGTSLRRKVRELEQELDSMPDGLTAVDEKITVDKLTKEVVDTFVEKVIVMPGQLVEVEWKFAK